MPNCLLETKARQRAVEVIHDPSRACPHTDSTWFVALCNNLSDDHGSCIIHMDGAGFHKRFLDKPTKSSNKTVAWLDKHQVAYSKNDTQAQLFLLVKLNHVPQVQAMYERTRITPPTIPNYSH